MDEVWTLCGADVALGTQPPAATDLEVEPVVSLSTSTPRNLRHMCLSLYNSISISRIFDQVSFWVALCLFFPLNFLLVLLEYSGRFIAKLGAP